MEDIVGVFKEKPNLKDHMFVEGLPGVGNVGKLAAEHLVDQLKAVKFAELFSKFFPPQVLVNDSGIIRLVSNDLYYVKRSDAKHDIVIMTGDYQGLTPEGHYEVSDKTLKIMKELGVKRVYPLGGYGLGKLIEKPRVLGAATDPELVEEMKKHGVTFSKGEPGSGIVGASGLLLGLGGLYDMRSACLMGETSGYFVDPKGAQAVLEVLSKILEVKIDFAELEAKAQQIDMITSKLRESEPAPEPKREELGYIG